MPHRPLLLTFRQAAAQRAQAEADAEVRRKTARDSADVAWLLLDARC